MRDRGTGDASHCRARSRPASRDAGTRWRAPATGRPRPVRSATARRAHRRSSSRRAPPPPRPGRCRATPCGTARRPRSRGTPARCRSRPASPMPARAAGRGRREGRRARLPVNRPAMHVRFLPCYSSPCVQCLARTARVRSTTPVRRSGWACADSSRPRLACGRTGRHAVMVIGRPRRHAPAAPACPASPFSCREPTSAKARCTDDGAASARFPSAPVPRSRHSA